MEKADVHQILQKYLKGSASEDEKALVDEWYNRMGQGKDGVLSDCAEESSTGRAYWLPIRAHIYSALLRSMKPAWYIMGIAATALLLFVAYVQNTNAVEVDSIQSSVVSTMDDKALYEVIANEGSESMTITLPDGSTATMEAGSEIRFVKPFSAGERKVCLHGKAFFSVVEDAERPFKVYTKEVITKVLGTSFTVSAFPWENDVRVSVSTGSVSVYPKAANGQESVPREVTLTANQLYVYNIEMQTASHSIVEEPKVIVADEVVKRMRFEDTSPRIVFEAIEKVYGVDIVFDEARFSSCKITTNISEGNIFSRLTIICKVINAEYKLEEGKIIIQGGGCHPYS